MTAESSYILFSKLTVNSFIDFLVNNNDIIII